jgi:hypothetical protein
VPRRTTVAIVQSCYIPWKGYFDLINSADAFILYDDRQYTRRDWRNRNRIKTRQGTQWLTIPVQVRGRYHQRIDETVVRDHGWAKQHWATLRHSYVSAPHFESYAQMLEQVYRELADEPRLSLINRRLVEIVCDVLSIRTPISWSTDYAAEGGRTERLVALCRAAGATTYLSGPTARAYLDESLFRAAGIELEYMNYGGYREYPQVHPPFDHHVTVLDLLFNVGPDAPRYLKSFADPTAAT